MNSKEQFDPYIVQTFNLDAYEYVMNIQDEVLYNNLLEEEWYKEECNE